MTAFVNVYHQRDEERNKVRVSRSIPHKTRKVADWGAERVWRGTGGACYRVCVEEVEAPHWL